MKTSTATKISALVISMASVVSAYANLQEAKITRTVNQVEVLVQNGNPQPAKMGDTLRGPDGLQTGKQSRAEMTFPDSSLVRLGANTLFSFERGSRNFDLVNGTILLQTPKKGGGGVIRTQPVTATITGTSVLMEYSPGTPGHVKIIALEGEVRLSLNRVPGESVIVGPGQMVSMPADAKRIPNPTGVDVSRVLRTSRLINEGPLINQDEIAQTVQFQREQIASGRLLSLDALPRPTPTQASTAAATIVQAISNRADATAAPPQPPAPAPQPPAAVPQAPAPAPQAPAPVARPPAPVPQPPAPAPQPPAPAPVPQPPAPVPTPPKPVDPPITAPTPPPTSAPTPRDPNPEPPSYG
jgi:hypothetical protein